MKNVTARTLIHERIDESAHGRAFAAYAALRNGAELVALALGGTLVGAAGGRGTVAISGAATVAIAALGLTMLVSVQAHATAAREAGAGRHPPPEEVRFR